MPHMVCHPRSTAVHGWHGQRSLMVANKEGDQFRRFLVTGIGRYLMDPVGRLVETLARLVNCLGGATFHLKPDRPLGDISDDGAGMAVRLVCFSGSIIHFNHGRAQVAAIQLRQDMRERSSRTGSRAGLGKRKLDAGGKDKGNRH